MNSLQGRLPIWNAVDMECLVHGYIRNECREKYPVEIISLILKFFYIVNLKWCKTYKSKNIEIADDYTVRNSKGGWGISILDCIITFNFKFMIKITDDSKEDYIRFLIGLFYSDKNGNLSSIKDWNGYFGEQGGNENDTSMGIFFYTFNSGIRGFGGEYNDETLLHSYGQFEKPKCNDIYELWFNFDEAERNVTLHKNGKEIDVMFKKIPKYVIPAVSITGSGYSLSIVQ